MQSSTFLFPLKTCFPKLKYPLISEFKRLNASAEGPINEWKRTSGSFESCFLYLKSLWFAFLQWITTGRLFLIAISIWIVKISSCFISKRLYSSQNKSNPHSPINEICFPATNFSKNFNVDYVSKKDYPVDAVLFIKDNLGEFNSPFLWL